MKNGGYIIKLYKRIIPAKTLTDKDHFAFIALMNFDGINIEPVTRFDDFRNATLVESTAEADVFYERQKILIYNLDEARENPPDVFGNDQSLPIMVVSLVDIPDIRSKQMLSDMAINIRRALDKKTDAPTIFFRVFATLSSSDYVIVFRGKTFKDVFLSIKRLKTLFNARSTYSIPAIITDGWDNWHEPGTLASIQISLNAAINEDYVFNQLKSHNTLLPYSSGSLIRYETFGKYDLEIQGEIVNNQNFGAMYIDGGILSQTNELYIKNVHTSNTRVLIECNNEENEYKEPEMPCIVHEDDVVRQIRTVNECKHVSVTVKDALMRLIIRVFQARNDVVDGEMYAQVPLLLDTLIGFIIHNEKKDEKVMNGISSINTLIDNLTFSGRRSFEAPLSNIRFTGASAKLLIAYTNVVNEVFRVFRHIKRTTGESREYYAFVAADIVNEVKAVDLYITNHAEASTLDYKKRFTYITIPFSLMYKLEYVLPWLIHELGHKSRFGWRRADRNTSFVIIAAYYAPLLALSKVFYNKLKRIKGHTNFVQTESFNTYLQQITNRYLTTQNINVCDNSACKRYAACRSKNQLDIRQCELRLEEVRRLAVIRFKKIIESIPYPVNGFEDVPFDEALKQALFESYIGLLEEIDTAYKESIADIFLLYFLKITSVNQYLDIINKFCDFTGKEFKDLGLVNYYRFATVLLYIRYGKTNTHISYDIWVEILKGIDNQEVRNKLASEITRFHVETVCHEMYIFIREHVSAGLTKDFTEKYAAYVSRERAGISFIDVVSKSYNTLIESKNHSPEKTFHSHVQLMSDLYYFQSVNRVK